MEMHDLPFIGRTNSSEETHALASRFARLPKPGDLVLLHGGLGAGKTQFVRGFCEGLGLREIWEVDSPTYTLVNHYQVGTGVDHIDLYRFQDAAELDEICFGDILDSPTIKVIEWPERLQGYPLPHPKYIIKINTAGETERVIHIATTG